MTPEEVPTRRTLEASAELGDLLEGLSRWAQAPRLWVIIHRRGDEIVRTWSADGLFSAEAARARTAALIAGHDWIGDQITHATEPAGPVQTLLLRTGSVAEPVLLGLDGTVDLRARPDLPAILQGSLMVIAGLFDAHARAEGPGPSSALDDAAARHRGTLTLSDGGVAHDFNNIIGAIAGFSATASLYAPPGSPIANNLAEIQVAVRRARSLVTEVLDRGRWPEGPTALVDVDRLLGETATLLGSSLPASVEFHIKGGREVGLVRGRYAALQQVLLNLCNNAAQAMPLGGRILCLSGRANLKQPIELSHGALPPGRYKTVSICDEGQGISAEALPRLFEPFFTTRDRGTGLGLASAASIIREHDGAIDVVSTPEQGSRFTLWLPAAKEGASVDGRVADGAGEVVLLLAKDLQELEANEDLIAALGYEARAHTDPRTLPQLRGLVDVVLVLDDGVDARAISRALGEATPILRAS